MLKRLKRLWKLSKKDPKELERFTPEVIAKIPEAPDGKAVFMGEGTQAEFDEQLKADAGTDKWYKRIKNL